MRGRNSTFPAFVQLESLQAESEADAAKRMKQEEELRQDVAEALEGFGAGDLDAEGLLAELRDLGIDVECSAEQLTLLAGCGSKHLYLDHHRKILHTLQRTIYGLGICNL